MKNKISKLKKKPQTRKDNNRVLMNVILLIVVKFTALPLAPCLFWSESVFRLVWLKRAVDWIAQVYWLMDHKRKTREQDEMEEK